MPGRHRMPSGPRHARARHRQPSHRAHWIAPVLLTAAVLSAGGAESLTGGSTPHRPQVDIRLGSGATTTPPSAPSPTTTPSSRPPSPQQSPVHRQRPPALLLAVRGSVSWVEVRGPHGRLLVSALVHHGHRLTFRRTPLHVVLGNAGAVRVSRNGGPARPAGQAGQVVSFPVR